MAYDPNDPADKALLTNAVKDAVAAALADKETEHEAEVAGLKAKRDELLQKVRNNEKGKPEDIERLETELSGVKKSLRDAEKSLRTATEERDNFKTQYETEVKSGDDGARDTALTEALSKAKVGDKFLPAVKALISPQVTIKRGPDGKRIAHVGDKSLGDHVAEWSQGDEGKTFVTAPGNGGGGGNGGKAPIIPNGGGKATMPRSQFDTLDQGARGAFFRDGGTLIEG